ncbi:hypothetical protein ACFE04_005493 [Oxalis oulophora]
MDVSRNIRSGYVFAPTDYKLVARYLKNFIESKHKSKHNSLPESLIKVVDVYSVEPWLLSLNDDGSVKNMRKHEGYFFAQRQIARNVNGKRPRRSLRGFWKLNVTRKPIRNLRTGKIVGRSNSLCFYRYLNKNRNKEEAIKTDYSMDEFMMGDGNNLSDWVICRIKFNGKVTSLDNTTATRAKRNKKIKLTETNHVNEIQQTDANLVEINSDTCDDNETSLEDLWKDFPPIPSDDYLMNCWKNTFLFEESVSNTFIFEESELEDANCSTESNDGESMKKASTD